MTKPMKFLLPCGRYQCRLIARNKVSQPSLEGGERAGLELQAVISRGPHAGHPLTFLVWGEGKKQRARALRQGEQLVVAVTQFTLASGSRINRVSDFRAEDEVSVIAALEDGQSIGVEAARSVGPPNEEFPAELLDRLRAAMGRTEVGPVDPVEAGPSSPRARPAFAADYATGFYWVGGKSGQRTLAEHERVLGQYAACDPATPTGVSGFISIDQYGGDVADYADTHEGSLAGYRGRCWARWIVMDLDGDGTDAGLDRVLDDARLVVGVLLGLGVPADAVPVFFSGRRGVHIMWPSQVLAAAPKDGFDATVGAVCRSVASLVGVEIDMAVYKPVGALRAPNTRHEESGLYKVLLPLDDLAALNANAVKQLAKAPRPFVMPDWSVSPLPLLHDLWIAACQAEAGTRRRTAAVTSGERRIFGDTFDLMVHGAPEGSRGMRFFKAAMNLLDFDCPEPLLHALLEPAARLSGYPMNEFTAQIDGAIKAHVGSGTSST